MSLYSYIGVDYHYWKLLRFRFKGLNVDCVSAPHAGGTLVCRHKPGKEFQENLLPIFPGKCSPDFTGKTMLERLMANYFCILTKVPRKLGLMGLRIIVCFINFQNLDNLQLAENYQEIKSWLFDDFSHLVKNSGPRI